MKPKISEEEILTEEQLNELFGGNSDSPEEISGTEKKENSPDFKENTKELENYKFKIIRLFTVLFIATTAIPTIFAFFIFPIPLLFFAYLHFSKSIRKYFDS